MKLRYWLKRPEDRLSEARIIKRDKPFELTIFVSNRGLNDGYMKPFTVDEAKSEFIKALSMVPEYREYQGHQFVRIECVDGDRTVVLMEEDING